MPERAVFKLCSGVGLGVDWSSVSDAADWGRNTEYLRRCWDWGKFNSCLVIGSFQPIVAFGVVRSTVIEWACVWLYFFVPGSDVFVRGSHLCTREGFATGDA